MNKVDILIYSLFFSFVFIFAVTFFSIRKSAPDRWKSFSRKMKAGMTFLVALFLLFATAEILRAIRVRPFCGEVPFGCSESIVVISRILIVSAILPSWFFIVQIFKNPEERIIKFKTLSAVFVDRLLCFLIFVLTLISFDLPDIIVERLGWWMKMPPWI